MLLRGGEGPAGIAAEPDDADRGEAADPIVESFAPLCAEAEALCGRLDPLLSRVDALCARLGLVVGRLRAALVAAASE
jgi:hypothetical protein